MKEEALKQRDEIVSCLLEELVKVRQNLAESEDVIRNLKTKIEELEEDKKTLRETTPDNSVAHLQDELIASKLREAEASLSLKDLKQRVQELNTQWQRHLQVCAEKILVFLFAVSILNFGVVAENGRGAECGLDTEKVTLLGHIKIVGGRTSATGRGPDEHPNTRSGNVDRTEGAAAEGDGAGDTGAGVDEPVAAPGRGGQTGSGRFGGVDDARKGNGQ